MSKTMRPAEARTRPLRDAPEAPAPGAQGAAAARSASLVIGVMFMGSTLLTPLYALYQRAFGFSEVTLTLIYAVYVVGNLAALFFFGRLSDRFGRRRTSLPAMALGMLATATFLLATGPPWLFVARALSGLAIGVAAAAATAWVAELMPQGDRARASALATLANMIGITLGPLLAGALAQLAPAPLRTSFVVYLALLALVAWRIARLPETVRDPTRRLRELSFRPRLGVPRAIRRGFVAPALAGFASFTLGGYYGALAPSLLVRDLGHASPALAGAVVAAFYGVAAVAVQATRSWPGPRAMSRGLLLLVPSIAALLLAQLAASIAALWLATVLGGAALALCYRGSLEAVNAMAPEAQRAEVVSSYMIACFLGNSLPVIGVAVLAQLAGHAVAHVAFALAIAALALVAWQRAR